MSARKESFGYTQILPQTGDQQVSKWTWKPLYEMEYIDRIIFKMRPLTYLWSVYVIYSVTLLTNTCKCFEHHELFQLISTTDVDYMQISWRKGRFETFHSSC